MGMDIELPTNEAFVWETLQTKPMGVNESNWVKLFTYESLVVTNVLVNVRDCRLENRKHALWPLICMFPLQCFGDDSVQSHIHV